MGFLDWLVGKPAPAKRKRGPSRSPAERAKLEEVRFLQEMKRTDPARYQQLMLQRLGLSKDEKDELGQLQGTVEKLKKMGLIKSANDIDSGGTAWVKDAVAGLGMFLQMMQSQGGAPPTQAVQGNQVAALPVQPAPVAAPVPMPEQTAPTQQTAEENMSLITLYLQTQLGNKSPEDAARWILSQNRPEVAALIQEVLKRPETEAYGMLVQVADAKPQLRDLGTWLRSKGELWVTQVAREIHRLSGQPGAAQMGF